MALAIAQLDHSICSAYVHDSISGLGHLLARLDESGVLDRGGFYCIKGANYEVSDLYPLDSGALGHYNDNFDEDAALIAFIDKVVNSGVVADGKLIAEDWSAILEFPYFKERKIKHYFSNDQVFYRLDKGADIESIRSVVDYVHSPYRTCLMLVDVSMAPFVETTMISDAMAARIIDNVIVFVVSISDSTNYMYWVKGGYEHVLPVLTGSIQKGLSD
ncbi:MAG: hypothetical protein V4649_05360 [Bacteroidota bacterium]